MDWLARVGVVHVVQRLQRGVGGAGEVDVAGDDVGDAFGTRLRGSDDGGEAGGAVVELVVAERRDVVVEQLQRPVVGGDGGRRDLRQRAHHVVAGGDGEAVGPGALGRVALGLEHDRAAGGPALDAGAGRGGGGEIVQLGAQADQVRVLVVGVEEDELARRGAAAASEREGAQDKKNTSHRRPPV